MRRPLAGVAGMAATLAWLVSCVGAVTLASFFVTGSADAAGTNDAETSAMFVGLAAVTAGNATLGRLVLIHRPGHRIGWLFIVTALALLTVFGSFVGVAARLAVAGPTDPLGGVLAWLAATMFLPAVLTFPSLTILFPDGRLPGRRWRIPVIVAATLTVISSVCIGVAPGRFDQELPVNPFGLAMLPGDTLREVSAALVGPAVLLVTATGLLSIRARYHRGGPDERRQLKWMGAAFVVVMTLFITSVFAPTRDTSIVDVASVLSLVLIPAATTIAILRYRLYEIDRIVSRTISWTLVSATLAGLYLGGVLVLQSALSGITQGETLAVAASTLVAAAAFQPLRRRIQELVDRRFHRARYDADLMATAFSERLRNVTDMGTIATDLADAARGSVAPVRYAIWIRVRGVGP